MLAALKARYDRARPVPVLPVYRQPMHPWKIKLRNRALLATLCFYGLLTGAAIAVLPSFLYMYVAVPLFLLLLVVIWALPEATAYPAKTLAGLLAAFYISLFLWPNYLAIALPGLPWITVQRLFLGPLALIFLVSLSVSRPLRAEIRDALRRNKVITRLMLGFVALQLLTTLFTPSPVDTVQRLISNQLLWTMTFFLSVWLFQKGNWSERWFWATMFIVFLISGLAIVENYNGAVLWAGHVPSFLAIEDPTIQSFMEGKMRAGTAIYRTQATFVTPLNLAEFLGLSTALLIHSILIAKRIWLRVLLLAYMPLHFWVIVSTDSRLGLVSFFGSCLAYLLVESVRRWRLGGPKFFSIAIAAGYPAILSMFFLLSFFWYRLHVMLYGGGRQAASTDARQMQWAMTWPKLAVWPFGRGPGTSGYTLGFTNADGVLTIDSYYIVLMLDYGVFGFVVYITLMLSASLLAAIDSTVPGNREKHLLQPLAVILVNFVVIKGAFSQENEHALIFIIVGMIVALRAGICREAPFANTNAGGALC